MTKPSTGQQPINNRRLLERLDALCARDRRVTAQLLWHLAEVDQRGLYRERGHSSLFNYCVQALHMSEAEAGLRIRVARTARRYPVIYRHVDRGELHLSAVSVLAPMLTPQNHQQLLRAAVHRTKAQVQQQVADLCPQPVCPDTVRKLPSARRQDPPGAGPSLFEHAQAPNAQPFARGGPATADNLALMCRAHNALLAERDFGCEHMARVSRQRVQASSHFLGGHRA